MISDHSKFIIIQTLSSQTTRPATGGIVLEYTQEAGQEIPDKVSLRFETQTTAYKNVQLLNCQF